MKKYKVFYENDPQEETIFCVKAKTLGEAITLASKIKDLDEFKFLSIYKVKSK
jgi:hypothetical protein